MKPIMNIYKFDGHTKNIGHTNVHGLVLAADINEAIDSIIETKAGFTEAPDLVPGQETEVRVTSIEKIAHSERIIIAKSAREMITLAEW